MSKLIRPLSLSLAVVLLGSALAQHNFAMEPNDTKEALSAIKSKGLSTQQFKRLVQFIKPSTREDKWRETPWIPSIQDGRKMSVAKNKPIFLWAMNGDPLGCV
jgi:hypothetical protein